MQLLSGIQALLNDPSIVLQEQVQSLWSGYGQIVRVHSQNSGRHYIVKVISPEGAGDHPRGWNTSASHQRKLRSYQVEAHFYAHYAALTDEYCRVPQLIANTEFEKGTLLVMQDLDAMGFSVRKDAADWQSLQTAICWLAHFHAKFMRRNADKREDGLWTIGTYWHLATRQDEWQSMPQSDFKAQAEYLDKALNAAQFQTLVHGDAKFENLCFHENTPQVAAVDFQYVGHGSGVKDLAYLAGSCLRESDLQQFGDRILDEYLCQLQIALSHYQQDIDMAELEREIRFLYPLAWADFYRFLLGWNPQSWKICGYMQQMSELGLSRIKC